MPLMLPDPEFRLMVLAVRVPPAVCVIAPEPFAPIVTAPVMPFILLLPIAIVPLLVVARVKLLDAVRLVPRVRLLSVVTDSVLNVAPVEFSVRVPAPLLVTELPKVPDPVRVMFELEVVTAMPPLGALSEIELPVMVPPV
jgi:hypothetical protein